ncbi:MAG TPA: hypothetical protein VK842_10530 [bacterium]|nr:hypothetical protein [bacterium]
MWKFSLVLVFAAAAALWAGPPAQDPSAFDQPGAGSMFDHNDPAPALDSNTLNDKVEEMAPLYDALARETRRLAPAGQDRLYGSLRSDYDLGGQVGAVRRILERSEGMLDLQDAIHNQQDLVKRLGPDAAQGEAQAKKLQDMELSLGGAKDELRRWMADQQKDLNEKDGQNLREWLMVSEGLLRHRRETAEAAALAHPAPEAPPLSAAGLSPTAAVSSPTAGAKP